MGQLRSAKKEDLHNIAEFITDRFWGLEQHVFLAEGLSNPKELISRSTEASLQLFVSKGDIYVYDDNGIKGVLVGIPAKKFSTINMLLNSLSSYRLLNGISKEDTKLLKEKSKLQSKIHDPKWYKKYSKNAYYINWIAVNAKCKGTGIFRKLISPIIDTCEKNHMDVVLETFTKSNVPIYEHFGFEKVETHTSEEIALSEYCMVNGMGNLNL